MYVSYSSKIGTALISMSVIYLNLFIQKHDIIDIMYYVSSAHWAQYYRRKKKHSAKVVIKKDSCLEIKVNFGCEAKCKYFHFENTCEEF